MKKIDGKKSLDVTQRTVSSYAGKGKRTVWSVWNLYPRFTKALATVFENPDNHDNDEVLAVIEKFVILVYERTSAVICLR